MDAQVSYPHIEKLVSGTARLKRVPRVRVAQIVMDYLAYGWSPDEMCRQHSYLALAEAHAAMAYYFDHQDEIDREIEAECREFDAARQQALNSSLRARLKSKGLL